MRKPPLKTSLDQLLKRIDSEIKIAVDMDCKSELQRKLKEPSVRLQLETVKRLEKELETCHGVLEKLGIETDWEQPTLSRPEKEKIELKYAGIRKRFRTQRDSILVRVAFVSDEERAFMVRFFFQEVLKEFPALHAIIGNAKGSK